MRKITLMFIIIVSSQFYLQAQVNSENLIHQKTTFGLRAGYEFQVNESDLSYKLKLPYIGAFSDFRLNNRLSLQLELNLRLEKRKRLFNDGFRESIDELYLTVPVLLKYHFRNKFKIYAGTQVLSASLVNNVYGLKKWNGIIGVEYDFAKNFFLDARFRHGFSEQIFRDNRLSFGFGYRF